MTGQWIRRAAFFLIVIAGITGAGLMLRAEPPQAVDTWAQMGTVPDARTSAASAVLPDGRTLIAGGALADGTSTDSIVIVDQRFADVQCAERIARREQRCLLLDQR